MTAEKNTVNLTEFCGEDDIGRLAAAADYLRKNPGSELIIPPGDYILSTELSVAAQKAVMSGEYGENPEKIMFNHSFQYSVGFDLSGTCDCTVKAYGAVFYADGFMEIVSAADSVNLTVEGLSLDHVRKPFSMGIVKSVSFTDSPAGYMDIVLGEEFPVNEKTPMPRFCLYDTYGAHFTDYNDQHFTSHELLPDGTLRLHAKDLKERYTGMEIYIWHTFHSRPAVLLYGCKNTVLRDFTIHSQPGMGIVADSCDGLLFDALRVVPSLGVHLSTNTDATHIISSTGDVIYENCLFEGQGDDSLNVHSYYHSIESVGGSAAVDAGKNIDNSDNNNTENKTLNSTVNYTAVLRLDAFTGTHSQKPDTPKAGEILELTRRGSLSAEGLYKILSSEQLDFSHCRVTLEKSLPENTEDYLFINASRQPRLIFRNNFMHSHLARAVLVKTKNALIENNTFIDTVGTAIHVAAEEYWMEGCCTTESIIIRRNRILFCGRNDDIRERDSAGITVTVSAKTPTEPTHKYVEITDNIIECPDSPRTIYVSNTRKLVLRRNKTLARHGAGITVEPIAPTEN